MKQRTKRRNRKPAREIIRHNLEARAHLSQELYERMIEMVRADARGDKQDFIRWLITEEWKRRNVVVAA